MNLRVVFDADSFIDALKDDSRRVFATLVEVCDQMIINELILREYQKKKIVLSAVQPKLTPFEEATPKRKIIRPPMGPKPEIHLPAHHKELIQGAVRSQANIVIMNVALRGRWKELAQNLQRQYQLRVLLPDQYVAERGRKN